MAMASFGVYELALVQNIKMISWTMWMMRSVAQLLVKESPLPQLKSLVAILHQGPGQLQAPCSFLDDIWDRFGKWTFG